MLWIKFLVFIGIVGVSYAADDDIYCYSQKLAICSTTVTDLCSQVSGLGNCISNSALSCSMKDDKDVKSALNFLANETCKAGTKTNKKYLAHWPCITKSGQSPECTANLVKALTELHLKNLKPDQLLRESFKLGCKFNDTVTTCTLSKVKKDCGDEAESFLRDEHDSGINQLSKRLCDYVNGVGRISFQLPLWVLQAAILLFIFKWSSY